MEGLMPEADLYEDDFIAWTEQQAKALREAARHPTNLGLDWEHLAEEVEDLGRSYRRALASHVSTAIEHLLKLEFSPATEPRRGWRDTVRRARNEIESWLEDEPGLRPRLPAIIEQQKGRAAKLAAQGLLDFDENAEGVHARLRDMYSDEQILGDWFPDARAVPPG
jgi:hypothetical protein